MAMIRFASLGDDSVTNGYGDPMPGGGRPGRAESLPGLAATNPEPTIGRRLWWMATQGNKWLLRRSTDLMPSLARLAAEEFWSGVRRNGTEPASSAQRADVHSTQ